MGYEVRCALITGGISKDASALAGVSQVSVQEARVDRIPGCGNRVTGIGLFAIESHSCRRLGARHSCAVDTRSVWDRNLPPMRTTFQHKSIFGAER